MKYRKDVTWLPMLLVGLLLAPLRAHAWPSMFGTETQQACCADIILEGNVGILIPGGRAVLPPSCYLDNGCGCPIFNMFPRREDETYSSALERAWGEIGNGVAPPGAEAERTSNRTPAAFWKALVHQVRAVTGSQPPDTAITFAVLEINNAAGGAGTTGSAYEPPPFWDWLNLTLLGLMVFSTLGVFYTATLPLLLGGVPAVGAETMPYRRRLLAVAILWVLCGGGTMFLLGLALVLVRVLWYWWGVSVIWWAVLAVFVTATFLVMRPLQPREPLMETVNHSIFGLLRDYFALEHVVEGADALAALAISGQRLLIPQLPHGIMPFGFLFAFSLCTVIFPGMWPVSGVVATALLRTPLLRHVVNSLGAREAGRQNIYDMFAAGFKAVGVVTGGIAEMYVTAEYERLTHIRNGFGRIALKGGYTIVPVFVYGVSRTYKVVPGFNNGFFQTLSRKLGVPLMLFYGAFCCVPYRQKMKMVVGSPITVAPNADATEQQARDICRQVEQQVLQMYDTHRPTWETRAARFVP